jgi:hypothetical protein
MTRKENNNMSKIFQVRYEVGDKKVAHEHYTEKGAKADAKILSKAVGNAMIGEIDVDESTGTMGLVRIWEFTGGEMGKPIKKEGEVPSEVEVLKTADDTRLPEGTVEKKPKAPKKTDEERIAEIAADARTKLEQIAAGTYVLPTKGRKSTGDKTEKAPKVKSETDKVAKFVEELHCTEHAAHIVAAAQLNVSRRARVCAEIVDSDGGILATEVASNLNNRGQEDRTVDVDDVMAAVQHINFKLGKHDEPWRIKSTPENDNFALRLVSFKAVYGDDDEGDRANVA